MPFPEAQVPALFERALLPALHYLFGLSASLAAGGAVLMLLPAFQAARSMDPRWGRLADRSARWVLALLLGAALPAGAGAWLGDLVLQPRAAQHLAAAFGPALAAGLFLALAGTLCLALYAFHWKGGRGGSLVHLAAGVLAAAGIGAGAIVLASLGSFSLSPGRWPETRALRHALLHPSAPSAILIWAAGAVALASAAGLVAAAGQRDAPWRLALVRTLGSWGAPAAWAGAAGAAWWAFSVSAGEGKGFPALAGAAFLVQAALGAYFYWRGVREPGKLSPSGALLMLLAAALAPAAVQLAGAEARGYFLIQGYMYRNGVLAGEIPELRREGFWRPGPWHAETDPPPSRELGALVFRAECGPCHPAWKEGARPGDLPPFRELGSPLRFLGEMEKRHPAFPAFAGSEGERQAVASHIEGLLKGAGVALAAPAPPPKPAPPKVEKKKAPVPSPAAQVPPAPRQAPPAGQPAPQGQPAPLGQPAPQGQPAPLGQPVSPAAPGPPETPAPQGQPAPQAPAAPQPRPAPPEPPAPAAQPAPEAQPAPPGQAVPPMQSPPPGQPVTPVQPVPPVPPAAPEPAPAQRREEPRRLEPPTPAPGSGGPPLTPQAPPAPPPPSAPAPVPGGGGGNPGVPGP